MFVIKCQVCEVETELNSYESLSNAANDIEIIETMSNGIIVECSCGNRICDNPFGGLKDE